MKEADDDLPVLTQILRTGNANPDEAIKPRARAHAADNLDPRTIAEGSWPGDQLVLGHEPPGAIESYLAPSFVAEPPVFPAEVRHADEPRPPDAFALSQDHDAPQGLGLAYDEPEYSIDPSADPPTEALHEDPSMFAERVRDAVLETLGTRIETELDARVAHAIHIEVETALCQLQANLRTHLAEALKDVVSRAVEEEIARLTARRSTGSA